MEMPVLLLGAIIGFGIAAPVGPIGLLCIQRTLQQGRRCWFWESFWGRPRGGCF